MEDQHEIAIPGKFSETEEAILDYLYQHPGGGVGSGDLAKVLSPELILEQSTELLDNEQLQAIDQALRKAQYGIETLIAARLVRGKRALKSNRLTYVQLDLTAKGQAEAIKQGRRLKKIISSVPRPDGRERPAMEPNFEQDGTEK